MVELSFCYLVPSYTSPKPAMLHVIDRTWGTSQRELECGIGYGFGIHDRRD